MPSCANYLGEALNPVYIISDHANEQLKLIPGERLRKVHHQSLGLFIFAVEGILALGPLISFEVIIQELWGESTVMAIFNAADRIYFTNFSFYLGKMLLINEVCFGYDCKMAMLELSVYRFLIFNLVEKVYCIH